MNSHRINISGVLSDCTKQEPQPAKYKRNTPPQFNPMQKKVLKSAFFLRFATNLKKFQKKLKKTIDKSLNRVYNHQAFKKRRCVFLVGVDDVEGPPVPIPNTVVKLNSAENTWLEAAREDRSTPTLFYLAVQ